MKSGRPSRLLVVTSSLNMGGADRQAIELVGPLQDRGYEIKIVSLTALGSMGLAAVERGFDVGSIDAQPGSIPLRSFHRLVRLAKEWCPDLIQGWMYHGNLAASVAGLMLPGRPVLWGVRHSLYNFANEKRLTRHVIRVSSPLSYKTASVVYNARISAKQHERIGFDPDKSIFIPNGFDCERYRPRLGAGERLRAELGLGRSSLLVGMIARFHPQKDHASLLQAVRSLVFDQPNLRLVLVGSSMTESNHALMALLAEHGLTGKVSLMGGRDDVHEIVAGLDICVLSSSFGEGFPNVIGEAMASGVPCVATDVGDCATIVGESGAVVQRQDPPALAAGIASLASLEPEARRRLGKIARARVVSRFSLDAVAQAYADLYKSSLPRAVQAA